MICFTFNLLLAVQLTAAKAETGKKLELLLPAALLLALVLPSARLSGASGPWQRLVNKGHALGARCPLPHAAALLLLATTHCTYCYALPTCTPTYVGTGTLRHKAASGAFSVLYTAVPPYGAPAISNCVGVQVWEHNWSKTGAKLGAKLEATASALADSNDLALHSEASDEESPRSGKS